MPAGRPTKYTEAMLETARNLSEAGAIESEIIAALKISEKTFYNWKLQFPDFLQAVNVGKVGPDQRVKRSMFENCIGYWYEEEQAIKVKTFKKLGNQFRQVEEIKVVKVRRWKPADSTSQIFWSKNRMRDEFQDGFTHHHELPMAGEVADSIKDMEKDL